MSAIESGLRSHRAAIGFGAATGIFASLLIGLSRTNGGTVAGWLALTLIVFGLFWMAMIRIIAQPGQSRWTVRSLIIIGLAARIALLPSAPLYEDDYVRYLWDGGVTAAGLNPYARTPASVLNEIHPLFPAQPGTARPLSSDATLGEQSGDILKRVTYPSVTTIYPPIAQLGFAAAHVISPWSLLAWKAVGLIAEMVTLVLLIGGLRAAGRAPAWAMLYWLCPLVIKDFANGAHMDVLLMPVLAATIWAMLASRLRAAALLIGVAAALKLWPLLLVPGLIALAPHRRDRIVLAILSTVSAGALLAPQLLALDPASSGLSAYAETWVRNSLAFPALQAIVSTLGIGGEPALLTRGLVAAIVVGLAVYWARRPTRAQPIETITLWRNTTLALLMLSPTGYSWYATWLVPFLVFAPERSAMLLVSFVGAYYLRFADPDGWGAAIAPWIGFAPAWAAITYAALRRRMDNARG